MAFRTHDDCDGDHHQGIEVAMDANSDIYVMVKPGWCQRAIRFRTPMGGGGASPSVYSALVNLIEAIERDNCERPLMDPPRPQRAAEGDA